jgi:pyruvate dehydrogenase E2 component (dihydrolipoamide acetyltransferase)
MPIELLMPALSPTMTEGTLARWLKKEGDTIKAGDVIAEIETDKATMEFEAVDEGVLGKILITDGTDNVKVNQPIGILLEEGEDASAIGSAAAPKAEAAAPAPKSEAAPVSAQATVAATIPPAAVSNAGERVFASPLARRIADQEGVDLKAVQGTGPHGRIIKADVEDALSGGANRKAAPAVAAAAIPAAAPVQPAPGASYIELPNNNMRKTIARRLLESKQQVPHFYLSVDCELDALMALRKQLNDAAEAAAGKEGKPSYKLSVNDFIIRATALAMRDNPAANASWTEAAVLQYTTVDISVAVAIDGGLITPIVKKADTKTISVISNEMKDLASRAREGKLKPEEYQGGGFSISNLGMFGIKQFNAIINPPQGCILAVGAGEQRPVVKGGALAIATVMTVTLSVDHRVVDGAVGAQFLASFKRYIEAPMLMVA